ncbi:MAG: GAF domain-containing protein, partial [Gemmatimonadota bacterium]|nr:GAF domain-containing protein [Gemmatimonadota bacterium]
MPNTFSGQLLTFARALLRADTFRELLDVTRDELERAIGYKHAWIRISDETDAVTEVRLVEVSSELRDRFREAVPVLNVQGDAIMKEVFNSDVPTIIADARSDPRADPRIVAALGNRTVVYIPLRLVDTPFGMVGTGTFGDEGVLVPTREQLNYLVAMTTQISVAASRLRYREQQAIARRQQEELQRRLAQVQRLESLGLMAGGVAHDFNNLLTIILACAQMAQLASNDPAVNSELEGIVNAATRGSALTRQLLVMSRSQPLEIRSIDLNLRLRELVTLLRRVMPENIDIDLIEHAGEMFVDGDASQLDQAFMNLCINAREAMPAGGRLTIEVEQVLVNGAYVETHPWSRPGRYILTTVTDTGVGMTPEVLERVFEPFFTTKA